MSKLGITSASLMVAIAVTWTVFAFRGEAGHLFSQQPTPQPPSATPPTAADHERETVVVAKLAAKYKGQTEARLWDGTRVDLLTADEAIEADWAPKWAESIGQSLYYSLVTGRKPAVILLTTSDADERHVLRCQAVCAKHGIRLYVEDVRRIGQ